MKKEIFNYLRDHCLTDPDLVDRLIISSFLHFNKIKVQKNQLLIKYIIRIDDNQEYTSLSKLLTIIERTTDNFNIENLIELFEFVVSPADKIVTGAVYTPYKIREFIVSKAFQLRDNIEQNIKVADISCGCGSFLIDAAKRIRKSTNKTYFEIYKDHLYGLDIQDYSINRSKLLLSLIAVSDGEDIHDFNFNLFVGDALAFEWSHVIENFKGFDIIVGNPPYVCSRNISTESRKLILNWDVCKTGHPDLYIPFFQIGLENIASNGFLGFITMNTFFKSVNGRALRQYLQKQAYSLKVIDFGSKQIFNSKSTYTCICLIEKRQSDYIEYIKKEDSNLNQLLSFNKVKYSSIDSFKGWNLSSAEILNKIELTGTPFGELYKTRNGIATLKNHIYIFKPVYEDNDYFFLQNGKIYAIEKEICMDIINPNKLTQNIDIESIKKKIIFPYYFDKERTLLLGESVLRNKYPNTYNYLKEKREILVTRDKGNGDYENWYAYGRNQSLERTANKLFFPHISPTIPHYRINTDENLLFHNGLAVITENEQELLFLQKLMSSNLFWFYIINSSKPYGSGYYSLSRNYIKNFGVYNFLEDDKQFIIKSESKALLNNFIENKYGITL